MKTKKRVLFVSFHESNLSEREWYFKIINDNLVNKVTLVRTDVNFAINVFCRYLDEEGLQIILGDITLPEKYRNIAEMQLASWLDEYSWNPPEKETDETSSEYAQCIFIGKDRHCGKPSFGRNPIVADLAYHGAYAHLC